METQQDIQNYMPLHGTYSFIKFKHHPIEDYILNSEICHDILTIGKHRQLIQVFGYNNPCN